MNYGIHINGLNHSSLGKKDSDGIKLNPATMLAWLQIHGPPSATDLYAIGSDLTLRNGKTTHRLCLADTHPAATWDDLAK